MGGGRKWAKSNVRDLKHEKVSSYSKSRTCHVNVRVTPDNLNTPNNKSELDQPLHQSVPSHGLSPTSEELTSELKRHGCVGPQVSNHYTTGSLG